MPNRIKSHGFTLVELLIVVVVISILTGVVLSVINISGVRTKTRDAQRKTDLAKIRSALELYYNDNRAYPSSSATGTWINATSSSNSLRTALAGFIDVFPTDSLYDDSIAPANACAQFSSGSVTSYRYNYITPNNGSRYILTAIMELPTSDDESKCASLSNWTLAVCGELSNSNCGCSGYTTTAPDICYGLQNPF